MSNREIVKNIFEKKPKLFIELISRYYPLDEQTIVLNENLLNWYEISRNKNIDWNNSMFLKYHDELYFDFKLSYYLKQFSAIEAIKTLQKDSGDMFNEWSSLSASNKLCWSIELLSEFKDEWNWYHLSNNKSMPWSIKLIEEFEDKWDWDMLSGYKDWGQAKDWIYYTSLNEISWTTEIIERFKNRWNWRTLSCSGNYYPLQIPGFKERPSVKLNTTFPWSLNLIEKYEKNWDWILLSGNPHLPWSEELIDKYLSKWRWENLLKNAGISWSKKLIDKYYDIVEKPYKWERENWEISIYRDTTPTKFLSPFWSSICYSNKIDWTESFIEEFQEILNFKNVLSARNDLPWTIDLLEKFEDKWDWKLLSENENLFWSEEMISRFEHKWNWNSLSKNTGIYWNFDLLKKYETKWNWKNLSANTSMCFNEEVIDYYFEFIAFHLLSSNKGIQWTEKLIDKYQNKLHLKSMKCNDKIPKSINLIFKYSDQFYTHDIIWNKFKFYIDNEFVIEQLKKIKTYNTMQIAGKKTTGDWIKLVGTREKPLIDCNRAEKWEWEEVYNFFEERINTRYINPINTLLNMKQNLGEGFAIVNLQCSLIETIESFVNGWIYHNDNKSEIKNGWYTRIIQESSRAKKHMNPDENLKNEDIFISFFKNREPFIKYNIDGSDFYKSVRCGLLHETQTKNNWKIKFDTLKTGLSYREDEGEKIIFRENFQRDLEIVIADYKKAIVNGLCVWDRSNIALLRKNILFKFNHICEKS